MYTVYIQVESPKLAIHCTDHGCQITVADTHAGQLSKALGTTVNSHSIYTHFVS